MVSVGQHSDVVAQETVGSDDLSLVATDGIVAQADGDRSVPYGTGANAWNDS